ncbi:MAG TPA: C-type lectin domain-containing protein [Myxococcota bacterium]|nr:C-type lectin domain-containing protein [Myxococcota bacterium]
MVLRRAAVTLLAVLGITPSLRACASTYALTPVMSWTDAEAYATSLGGHLVVIGSQAEQDLLVSEFGGTEPLWIGLNDLQVTGVYQWVDGEPVTYTNWLAGEPNDFGIEDYGEMNWQQPGKWNNATNLPPGRGIIEFAPEPAAGASLALAALSLAALRGRSAPQ